jgi:multidrug transporter EmrE-like cation transporter
MKQVSAMFLFYFSVGLAISSTLLYHVTQKLTPTNVNPALALFVTYAVSLILCGLLVPFFPLAEDVRSALGQLNWASFGLAFAIVGLEVGFLLAYRAGWNISIAAIFVNVAGTLLLAPIGLLFFKERLSPVNLLGILVCILGLIMVNWKR